jgi:hypothetical protein
MKKLLLALAFMGFTANAANKVVWDTTGIEASIVNTPNMLVQISGQQTTFDQQAADMQFFHCLMDKGHYTIDLYNDLGTKVASAAAKNGAKAELKIVPVATGLDGDNGSTAAKIIWDVDDVDFGVGSKIDITLSGMISDLVKGCELFIANSEGDRFDVLAKGAGHATASYYFSVVP